MKNIIIDILKKLVFAICLLYAFDVLGGGLKVFIPINIITIGVISALGMSGLLALIAVYFALL